MVQRVALASRDRRRIEVGGAPEIDETQSLVDSVAKQIAGLH